MSPGGPCVSRARKRDQHLAMLLVAKPKRNLRGVGELERKRSFGADVRLDACAGACFRSERNTGARRPDVQAAVSRRESI
jgi:hypothetical protein